MRTTITLSLLTLACGSAQLTTSSPCTDLLAGDLVITEMLIDPESTDTGNEWFEVTNPGARAIDLSGVELFAADSSGEEKSLALISGEVRPGAYFVFGDAKDDGSAWLDFAYGTALGSFSQSGGKIGLRCGSEIIDEARWASPPRAGRSRMLDEEAGIWCDAPADRSSSLYSSATGNRGSPGEANPSCTEARTCLDENGEARPVVSPLAGEVVITEIMAAPKVATDSVGEWFELYSTVGVDLNGLAAITSTNSSLIDSTNCLRVEAGQYALVARSSDAFINGGLPAPLARFSGSFSSNNERLALFAGDAGLDEIAVFKSSSGVSWQLGSEYGNNDDPHAFCLAKQAWPNGGGDHGTPGAPNTPCDSSSPTARDAGGEQPADPNTCIDPKTQRSRATVTGTLIITEIMADPSAVTDDVGEWVEALTTSAFDLNGLQLGNDGSAHSTISSAECLPVTKGKPVLFARTMSTAKNGGLPAPDATFSFGLANSGSRYVRLSQGGTELARIAYSSTTAGASTQRDPKSGQWCVTPQANRYGSSTKGDRGTPGKTNISCP